MTFILAKKTLKERPHGFLGCQIEGRRGIGKSTYCIKVMKDMYKELYGYDEDEAYKMALKYTLFSIDDIITTVKDARSSGETIPVITWDDAGVHGSSLQWFINMQQVQQLKAITDTIRTAITGFFINCPDRSSLMAHLRNYDDYLVEIVKGPGGGTEKYKSYERIARGYSIFKLPSGKRMVYKNWEDHYSCYIPDRIYSVYEKKRNLYLDAAVKQLEETRDDTLSKKHYHKIDFEVKKIELAKRVSEIKKHGGKIDFEENGELSI